MEVGGALRLRPGDINVETKNITVNSRVFKGTGTRDLIWLKVVSLERS